MAQTQPVPMTCNIGPLKKAYGGSDWGIYSCTDNKTVVLYSIAGTPAAEFYFMFFRDGEGLHLYGEGTGDKQATSRAQQELSKLTAEDVDALIEETKLITSKHDETNATAGQGDPAKP